VQLDGYSITSGSYPFAYKGWRFYRSAIMPLLLHPKSKVLTPIERANLAKTGLFCPWVKKILMADNHRGAEMLCNGYPWCRARMVEPDFAAPLQVWPDDAIPVDRDGVSHGTEGVAVVYTMRGVPRSVTTVSLRSEWRRAVAEKRDYVLITDLETVEE
jgi:hypothetical protein